MEKETIGHYRIVRLLGAGGMGRVYRAEDVKLGRGVALKILPDEFARDESRMRRFVREAKAASAVSHPNVAQIYEVGEDAGTSFITMEFVEGSLRAVAGSFTRTSILDLTWSLTMRDISIGYTVSVCGNMPRNSMVFDTLRLLYK